MIFAFLFGLSMDYEVFMLTRMREAYDETGDTPGAIALGLARTGKLVTSAALILMFAFFVLSSSPGLDIKQFGIGLAAGIIFDATVIRALLVPSLMRHARALELVDAAAVARLLFVRASPLADARLAPPPDVLSPRADAGRARRRRLSVDSSAMCGICGIASSQGRVDRERLARDVRDADPPRARLRGHVRRRAASGSPRGGSRSST